MHRSSYDGLREPRVTLRSMAGSRAVQVTVRPMISRYRRQNYATPHWPTAGFAQAERFSISWVLVATTESRVPQGTRVD